MMRSKLLHRMYVKFVREYNDECFIGEIKGHNILCHKDFWEKVGE